MATSTTIAIKALTEALTEIAAIVRDLDPGRTLTYERIEQRLTEARRFLRASTQL